MSNSNRPSSSILNMSVIGGTTGKRGNAAIYHPSQKQTNKITQGPWMHHTHLTSAFTEIYLLQSQPNAEEILPTNKKTLISSTFPPKQAKTQSNSTPVSKQLIPAIKQSTLDELLNSDKGKFTTKNKYILNNVQQPKNKIPAERTKKKKCQL